MTEQQEKILKEIAFCEKNINKYQNLKECLELVLEILPVLDRVSLEKIKEYTKTI